MPEQKLTWEQQLYDFVGTITEHRGEFYHIVNEFKSLMKLAQEKAFNAGARQEDIPPPHDFETWYQNTYNK